MKVIIAGCRNWRASRSRIQEVVEESGFEVTELVSGGAPGIDESGEIWAKWEGVQIQIFRASWTTLGRKAGPIRNAEMAKYADALIAFWDGKSRGTGSMIREMRSRGKPYHVVAVGNVTLIDTKIGKKIGRKTIK